MNLKLSDHINFALNIIICLVLISLIWKFWPYRFSVSDAVAQFSPSAQLALGSYANFDLPLYNYHQHLGIPLMGNGYYPVADPIYLISLLISKYLLNSPQLAWDITCSIYILTASLFSYLYCKKILKIAPIISVMASISWAFSGTIIFFGGEWLYTLTPFTYIPIILLCFDKWMLSDNTRNLIFLAVLVLLFLLSSNIQIVFYSLHLIFALLIFRYFKEHKKSLLNYFWLFLVISGLSYGYVMLIFETASESIREVGKVPLDKYFWLAYDWRNSFKYSILPLKGNWSFMQTPGLYFQGTWVVVGILLSPIYLIIQKNERVQISILIMTTILFYLLAIGADGFVGQVLYKIRPYNMFRHSVKWAPFYQMASVILSFYIIDRILKNMKTNSRAGARNVKKITLVMLFIQIIMYVYFISGYDNKSSRRLTDVTLPIIFDTKDLDNKYRITGLWDAGDPYKTDFPMHLLGYNFASLFNLYNISGYEPMMPKKNDQITKNWHPGYYLNAKSFDLRSFYNYSLRYILVPSYQVESIKRSLNFLYPDIPLKLLSSRAPSKAVVLEVQDPIPLVTVNQGGVVEYFDVKGNSVNASLKNIKYGSIITFSWVANNNFYVYVNGKKTSWYEDDFGRISVKLPEYRAAIVELMYFPKKIFIHFLLGLGIFLLGIFGSIYIFKRI